MIETSSRSAQPPGVGLALERVKGQQKRVLFAVACSLFCGLPINASFSSPLVNVTFSGDNGQLSTYYSSVANDLNYAAAEWEKLFVRGSASFLNVDIIFDNSPTANASSLFITPLYSVGPLWVSQQGAVDAVLDGLHNPSGPYDAAIHIGTSYLTNELWFDPNPANTDSIPIDKTDAASVFLHEFGHIFAFQGDRNQLTGAPSPNAESTFDALVSIQHNTPYFTGYTAETVYGGAVPLTVGNIYHVGNPSGPGANLETYPGDLMNGNVFYRGTRYTISALDAAIAADLEFVTEVPEPRTIGMFCAYAIGFWLARRWSRLGTLSHASFSRVPTSASPQILQARGSSPALSRARFPR
jgi:hypothetical protein